MAAETPSLDTIFCAAIEIDSAEERAAYIGRACAADPELHGRVDKLVRAHFRSGSFLESPIAAVPSPLVGEGQGQGVGATVDDPITERPGTVIGPYKLLQQIGEGGMGTVFMAEQTHPVQRKVALKIIKPGMDTRQVIARFEAERQALALMDHPNIAKVLDAGSTGEAEPRPSGSGDTPSAQAQPLPYGRGSGRPYFVMELVKGIPITKYCDEHRLTPRQRLELFVPVCQAVQHAHQKGIIHRDLKPSNVMVCLYDGKPVPKVIDFGVAKAAGPKLTEATLFTEFGQVVGTFEYMSPEQAELNQLDIDTRSDIYSLGVLLYELLTGTTPLEHKRLKLAAFLEVLRLIREEEPPKPSTRLSDTWRVERTAQSAENKTSNRRGASRSTLRALRFYELDWIVMKALEKDRNRRYESASAFAADVQRYLDDEPVHACPPSSWYRFRKFARRNKRMAVLASFVFAMLMVAVAVLGVSYAQVQEALQGKTQALEHEQEALQEKTRSLERERRTLYYHSIALAHRELTANLPNPRKAEELLDACAPDQRRWEWHYLKRLGRVEPVVLRDPDKQEINSVSFSPSVVTGAPSAVWRSAAMASSWLPAARIRP